jgi:hypothetical protein
MTSQDHADRSESQQDVKSNLEGLSDHHFLWLRSTVVAIPKGSDHVLLEVLNDQVSLLLIFRIYSDFHCVEHTTSKVNPSYSIHIFSFEGLGLIVGRKLGRT